MPIQDVGNHLFREGNFVKAEQIYTDALKLEPKNAILICNRSNSRLKQDKFKEALEDAMECIKIKNSESTEKFASLWKAWYIKGYCEYRMGSHNEAVKSFLKALEQLPGDYQICLSLLETAKQTILFPNFLEFTKFVEIEQRGGNVEAYIQNIVAKVTEPNSSVENVKQSLETLRAYFYLRIKSIVDLLKSVFFAIIFCFTFLERHDEALVCGHIALGIALKNPERFNDGNLSDICRSIGASYYYLIELENAEKFQRLTIKYADASGEKLKKIDALNSLGLTYLGKANLFEGHEKLELGLSILETISINSSNEADISLTRSQLLENLAIVYAKCGDVKRAIKNHEEAADIAKSNGDVRTLAQILLGLKDCYFVQGNYQLVLEKINEVKNIWNPPGWRLKILYWQGDTYFSWAQQSTNPSQKEELFNKATAKFDEIIQIYKSNGAIPEPDVLFCVFIHLASKCLIMLQTARAVDYNKEAVAVAVQFNLQHCLGEAYAKLAVSQIEDMQLEDAVKNALIAEKELDALKATWKIDKFLAFAGHTSWECYTALEIAYLKLNDIKSIVEVAERRRSQALARKYEFSKISSKLSFAEIQNYAKQNRSVLIYYSKYPITGYIVDEQKPEDIEYNKFLQIGSKIIAYIVFGEGDPFMVEVNFADDNFLSQLSAAKILTQSSRDSKKRKIQQHQERTEPEYKKLYNFCWEKIEVHLKRIPSDTSIIILPQEELNHIPFSALQNSEKKRLIEIHPLTIAPSISVLMGLGSTSTRVPFNQLKMLAVGNPTMPMFKSFGKFKDIPVAEDEARYVAELFNADPICGSDATKSRVLEEMPNANIIHIATHGVSPEEETNSTAYIPGALVFAKLVPESQFDEISDCIIFPEEIQQKNLEKCELTVLTCCYGGNGSIKTDEGLLGIGRALLFGGVKVAILSLWAVPDAKATLNFMKYFYEAYKKFRKAAFALQEAQIKMISDGCPEKNWAAYYVYGSGI